MRFRIRIVKIHSSEGPRFMFSADMEGSGGVAPSVTFHSFDKLMASLRSINVDEEHIGKMQKDLATRNAASIPNVYLTDRELVKLGLYVLGRKKFAAISAVEGLKLNSEGAERLESTRNRSTEERRAETIQAFAWSGKRG